MNNNPIRERSNSIIHLNEREILTRIKIINSFKLSEEAFYRKYFCDRDSLFNICLPSYKKLVKERPDIKFISLYLSHLKKFTTLLQNINEDNNNNTTQKQNKNQKDKYFKLLKYVSENITYEHFNSKRLIMRYGEFGSKFYIILSGFVSILIPVKINIQMTFLDYNRYIANLLFYQEFELAKIIIRENKHIFRIDLPDIKYVIKYFKKNKNFVEDVGSNKNNNGKFNHLKIVKSEKNIHATFNIGNTVSFKLGSKKISKIFKENSKDENDYNDEDNEYFEKIEKYFKLYLTKEQLRLLEDIKKQNSGIETDDGIEITAENYIKRIQIYKYINNNETQNQDIKKFEKKHNRRLMRSKTSKKNYTDSLDESNEYYYQNKNKNSIYIYEYQEIIQLETGDMFGDTALSSSTAKRTATIISASECHFGGLNKDIYNSIKFSNEKIRRNMINYICRTRIFKSMKYKTIEDKYLNYFAFKNCVQNEFLIKFGEINNNIIIIKNGKYEINIKGGLENIYELINEYYINLGELKNFGLTDNIIRKINKLNLYKNKIQKLFNNNQIKKNVMDDIYKLFLINSSSIFGFKEVEKKQKDNDYLSFLEIKCISSEGEYILLDKRIFYKQIYATDYQVKEETRLYIQEFTTRTINRLVHILYSKIYYLLSKNNLNIFKSMKLLTNKTNEKNIDETRNLFGEIKLDFNYMNKYDLTDIECIVDKILGKFTEQDFDNMNNNVSYFNIYENNKDGNIAKKNVIKLVKEKNNFNNYNKLFKQMRNFYKISRNKLMNFRYKKINRLTKNNSILSERKLSHLDKIRSLFNFNDNTDNKNFGRKNSKIRINIGKNHSFIEEMKSKDNIKYNNRRQRNSLYYNNPSYNNSEINKSSSLNIFGKTSDYSFVSDVNINCNYTNYRNACISKLNFSFNFKKENSTSGYETSKTNKFIDSKMNQIFGSGEKYKSEINKCFSAKHSNYSSIRIFDSNKITRDAYSENRRKYVLKCVRDIWTRNSPIILYIRKKKIDKKL